MAATSEVAPPHEPPARRRPFTSWMRKLTNFKGSSSNDTSQSNGSKRNVYHIKSHQKKQRGKNNSPYLNSALPGDGSAGLVNGNHRSFSTAPTRRTASESSFGRSGRSFRSSFDGVQAPTTETRSNAPTLSTDADAAISVAAHSHGASSGQDTSATVGAMRGAGSTFSSPAPSIRSLTTTLTTIHSTAAAGTVTTNTTHSHNHGSGGHNSNTVNFSHQFPTSPGPSALPAHLLPQSSGAHPATYNTATANNLLTDNASILTLASSSKRRRRRSMDTDASVRALAPSSLFGNSRESLPLSVLSATVESNTGGTSTGLHQPRQSVGGPNERASIYSAAGVAPALPSDRNSYYANKQNIAGDGSSVKSGLLGHGRNDSITGSIGGMNIPGSPLAGPREVVISNVGRVSRRNSAWGENAEGTGDTDKGDGDKTKQ